LHSRFKPGHGGGPGRPKGSKNRATLFARAFDTARPVTRNGKRQRLTAQELAYIQLARAAAEGDLKAIALSEQIRDKLMRSGRRSGARTSVIDRGRTGDSAETAR